MTTKRRVNAKEAATVAMYKAVAKYARLHGGNVVVAGGVQVMHRLGDAETKFTIGIVCMGKRPIFPNVETEVS